jgi:hypothetical protein
MIAEYCVCRGLFEVYIRLLNLPFMFKSNVKETAMGAGSYGVILERKVASDEFASKIQYEPANLEDIKNFVRKIDITKL